MKKAITILLIIINAALCAFGQNNNEKLYQAIIKSDTVTVKQLLRDKADPDFIKAQGPWMKVNMLITAVNKENISIVKMLVASKANVKWKDGFNTTALIYAAGKGNKKMVILLLDNGADINDNDGKGNTVLSAAKESKNKELIEFVKRKLKEKQ